MKTKMKALIILVILALFSKVSITQILYNNVGHIPSDCQVDWTNAGLLSSTPTIADNVFPVNLMPGSNDSYKVAYALNLAKQASGTSIVYFPAGNYYLNNPIVIDQTNGNNIIIQGAGSNNTHLYFTVGKNNFCFDIHGTATGSEISVENNIVKGTKALSLSSNPFQQQDWIHFCESDFPVESWASVGQITQIENINGNSITMKDEASKSYSEEPWVQKVLPIQNVGIENLRIWRSDTEEATIAGEGSNICLKYAVNCWVKGVASENTCRHHVYVLYSSHIEVSGCYFYNARSHGQGGRGYGVLLECSTTNCLIENNQFKRLRHSMLIQAGANCNVFTYNFSTEQYIPYGASSDLTLHGNYPYANLFEHNTIERINADDTHSNNGPYNAFLRNSVYDFPDQGWNSIWLWLAPSTAVLGCEAGGDYPSIVTYEGTSLSVDIYGFYNGYGGVGYEHNFYWLWPSMKQNAYLYDVSYYYSSRPDFLPANYTWPSMGPRVDGLTSQEIPAEDRNGTYISDPTFKLMSASGELTYNEVWHDTHNLTGDIIVPSEIILIIESGASINLNGYCINCTGNGKIIYNGNVNDYKCSIQDGSYYKAFYPPSISIPQVINWASSGQTVHIASGTYSESFSMKSGVDVVGAGDYWTTLNGNIDFYGVDGATLSDVSIGYAPVEIEYSENVDIEDVAFMSDFTYNVMSTYSEFDIEGCHNYLSGQSGADYPIITYGSDLFLYASDIHDAATAYEATYYSTGYVHLTTFCGYYIDIDATSGYPSYDSYVNALYEVTFSDDPDETCLGDVDYPSSGYETCGYYKESAATVGLSKSGAEDPPVSPNLRDNPEYQDFFEALDGYYDIKIEQNEAEESGQSVSPESYISDYETIIEKLKTFITEHPEDELAGTAMRLIGTIYQKLNNPEAIVNYANSVLNDTKLKKAEWHAKKLLLAYHIKQNNTQFALALADELVEETEKEDQKCLMLYEKGLIYKHSVNDQKKAVECFEKIIKKYMDNPISELAALQLELLDAEPGFEKSGPSVLSGEEDLALTNYPNPSNPETVIYFRLPEQGQVTLRIFDVRGREVQTLIDREMASGEHRINWNGEDSMGNLVASGIYFYQIQFRDKVLTKKLTLIR